MTVCIATNNYHPSVGGIPNFYKYLTDILTSFGHRVIILTIEDSPAGPQDTFNNQGLVTIVTLRSTYIKYLAFYRKYFRPGSYTAYQWIAMGYAMKEWLLNNHAPYAIDIIETTDFGGVGIFLVDYRLPPVIVVGHSSATQISARSYMKNDDHLRIIKQLEHLSFTYCDAIVAHSPMNQQDLAKLTKRLVHFARAPWIIPQKANSLTPEIKTGHLVVSSLQMIKGAEIMAKAIRIAAVTNRSLKIYWIGGDSHSAPQGEKVSSFLRRNYPDIWDKNFIWMGEKGHEEVLATIAQAGIAIIPSCWETFNYFALEAIYFEKPLIITESTGISYLLHNQKSVTIIPSGSPEELSRALLEQALLTDENKKEPDLTKQKILDYFSPDNIISDREKLYNACQTSRNGMQDKAEESLEFIKKYTTTSRKYYFVARKRLKKIITGRT